MAIDLAIDALDLGLELPSDTVITGSVIEAVLHGSATRDLLVTGGEAALVRTVKYRHRRGNPFGVFYTVPARKSTVVARQSLDASVALVAGGALRVPIALALPADGLGSVAGTLIRVDWAIRAHLLIAGSPGIEVTRSFVVLSPAADRAEVEQRPTFTVDHRCAVLGYEALSSRLLVGGSPVSGVLTVTARRPGFARELRVDLVLREQVHHGPWIGLNRARNPADQERSVETVIASAQLADRLELDPTRPLRRPFSLDVPALSAPSMQTQEFTVSWILRGVLSRALHQDPWVEIEMNGVTAAG